MRVKRKINKLFKSFFYVILSNFISVSISVLVVLIVPKFIGVTGYGYWQLYILYTSFVGFLHFGWNDGLYLRLGGYKYSEINKKLYFCQFYMLLVLQLLIAFLGYFLVQLLSFDVEKNYVLGMTAVCMVIVNSRYMLLFLLQATYRIKEYSFITILDRISYLILIAFLVILKAENYKYLILADVVAKLLSLAFASLYCKDVVFKIYRDIEIKLAISEMVENIRAGIKLMLSNIASKLVVGNVRMGVEGAWSIVVFGKISLMLSITGFLMVFINSISLVLFPFLRRVEEASLKPIYQCVRDVLTLVLMLFLLTFYPVSIGLGVWLPEYQDSLRYLLILYPIVLFEGKMSLLVNTYLKVLREESLLLKVNVFAITLSFILTYLSVRVFRSVDLAVFSILILVCFRSVMAEVYVQKILNINLWRDVFFDVFFVFVFIFGNIFFDAWFSFFLSFFLVFVYFFVKRRDFLIVFLNFKNRFFLK